jgi:adenylate cyclase
LAVAFEDLGEQRVKNIARPIRAFQLRLNDGTEFPEGAEDGAPEPPQADEVEMEFWDGIELSANPLELTRRCHPARRGLRDGPLY